LFFVLPFSDFYQKLEEFPLVEPQAVLEEWAWEEQQEEQQVI